MLSRLESGAEPRISEQEEETGWARKRTLAGRLGRMTIAMIVVAAVMVIFARTRDDGGAPSEHMKLSVEKSQNDESTRIGGEKEDFLPIPIPIPLPQPKLPFTAPEGYPCMSVKLAVSLAKAAYSTTKSDALSYLNGARASAGWGGCPKCNTVGSSAHMVISLNSGAWYAWAFVDEDSGNLYVALRGSAPSNYPGNAAMFTGDRKPYQHIIDAFGRWIKDTLEVKYGPAYAIVGHSAGGFFGLTVPSRSSQVWRITFNSPGSVSGKKIINFKTSDDKVTPFLTEQYFVVGSGGHGIANMGRLLSHVQSWKQVPNNNGRITGASCTPALAARACGSLNANHAPHSGTHIATTGGLTVSQCASKCEGNIACNCYSFDGSSHSCYEYKSCSTTLVSKTGWSCGFCRGAILGTWQQGGSCMYIGEVYEMGLWILPGSAPAAHWLSATGYILGDGSGHARFVGTNGQAASHTIAISGDGREITWSGNNANKWVKTSSEFGGCTGAAWRVAAPTLTGLWKQSTSCMYVYENTYGGLTVIPATKAWIKTSWVTAGGLVNRATRKGTLWFYVSGKSSAIVHAFDVSANFGEIIFDPNNKWVKGTGLAGCSQ